MLNLKVKDLINAQINKETFSAYLYLDISNKFYDMGLDGFGNWYKIQAKEEWAHADLLMQYMQQSGESVELKAIAKPNVKVENPRKGVEIALAHERYITAEIYNIYELAHSLKDYKTVEFLNWFVKEQGEEEKNAEDLLKKYDLYGADNRALYMLDKELATRVFVPPSLVL